MIFNISEYVSKPVSVGSFRGVIGESGDLKCACSLVSCVFIMSTS